MPKLRFNLISDENSSQLTVYHDGETYSATQAHPAWQKIYNSVVIDDNIDAIELFKPIDSIRKGLTERISINDSGQVFYDQDSVDPALTDQLVRIWGSNGDVSPWTALLENILSNPYKGSQEQIYRHLRNYQYTITPKGHAIAYKYVRKVEADDGTISYKSVTAGPAIVDGVEHKGGQVPQNIGSVVEMARGEVTYDPAISCAHGLHVASWSYVKNNDCIVAVEVNPRDIVSVPHDYGDAKVRVCRYRIIEEVTEPYEDALYITGEDIKTEDPGYDAYDEYDEDSYENEYYDEDDYYYADGDSPAEITFPDTAQTIITSLGGINTVPDEAQEVQSTEKETDTVSTATRVRYPRPADWDHMVARAKTRKQNLVKYITKMTDWQPVEGRDQTDRKGWAI